MRPPLFKDAAGHLVDWDFAALRTFRALVTRPGGFTREYLLGRRNGFWGPLRYYALVIALNVCVSAVIDHPGVSPIRIEGGGSF